MKQYKTKVILDKIKFCFMFPKNPLRELSTYEGPIHHV